MFGRMEPGTPEWGRALDAHLQPPEYDGCEDCECEDPDVPEAREQPCNCGLTMGACDCDKFICRCDCHNVPHDPREDGDDPDPEYYDDQPDFDREEGY